MTPSFTTRAVLSTLFILDIAAMSRTIGDHPCPSLTCLKVLDLNEIEEHGILGGVGGNSDNFGYGVVTEEDDIEQCPPAPALGCMKLSPDQRMLACTIDAKGNDRFMLALFDLSGGGSGGGGSGSDALGRSSTGTAITLRDDAM